MRSAASTVPFDTAHAISTAGHSLDSSASTPASSSALLPVPDIDTRSSRRRLADSRTPLLTEVFCDEDMADKDGVVTAIASDDDDGLDSGLAKRVLRKIDMRLIPLLFITYNLNFMDKTILSSASVFGLKDSTVRRSRFVSHVPIANAQ